MDVRLTQRDSAHLNGTLIHGLDYDDTHSGAVVHTSASAVPTMLAAGQATGADGIPAVVLKITAPELSPIPTKLFNRGVREKCFPSMWKKSSVCPVYKNSG